MALTRSAGLEPQLAAEKAVWAIGSGYDVCRDVRLSGCKSKILELDFNHTRELVFPGDVVVPNVPTTIKCHQGERFRISSGLLSFEQMSEQFNQELSLSGKIPSGLFNAMFDMRNGWKKDAVSTKSLAFDGWFITLYNVELDRTRITISKDVIKEVPTSWNPAALAQFIEKYGTHIVVGVKMGGKDVVHIKQSRNSDLCPDEVDKLLQQVADERFSEDLNRSSNSNSSEISGIQEDFQGFPWEAIIALAASGQPYVKRHSEDDDDIISLSVRRGGIVGIGQHHNQWISTISQSPNVVSMSFVPITSFLNSVSGSGFLSHAVNLYLRYKPPVEELHPFLEFQLPRQWAPMYGDLPLGFGPKHRRNMSPVLRFTLTGPKLYVNTLQVDSGLRPVTGIRLFLEGRNSDHLGIHLQHLSNLPSIISGHTYYECIDEPVDKAYFEPVKWRMFSHVCTAPVEYNSSHFDESTSCIVTKAWFEVRLIKMKKVLFLRLGYSTVASSTIRRSEWDGTSSTSRKSGFFSALWSTRLSQELHPPGIETEKQPKEDAGVALAAVAINGNSNSNTDAPVPTKAPKMLRFIDTKEIVRGPGDFPGYWVVTGVKLCVVSGKISIQAKYSLLDIRPRISDTTVRRQTRISFAQN